MRRATRDLNPYSRTRNKQLVRVLRMVVALRAGYCRVDALARQFKVSRRTIRRDLAAISHVRVGLLTDGRGTYTIG